MHSLRTNCRLHSTSTPGTNQFDTNKQKNHRHSVELIRHHGITDINEGSSMNLLCCFRKTTTVRFEFSVCFVYLLSNVVCRELLIASQNMKRGSRISQFV